MRTFRSLLLTSVGAAAVGVPMLATADSSFGVGVASANLDFEVVIQDYVYFRVGAAAGVDLVTFNVDAGANPPGTGSVASPDSVTVVLTANSGNVDLSADSSGTTLTNGTDTIPWSEITINTTGTGDLPPPVIDGADSTGLAPVGTLSDTWSFSYANDTFYSPGNYGGVGTATVTFTATAM